MDSKGWVKGKKKGGEDLHFGKSRHSQMVHVYTPWPGGAMLAFIYIILIYRVGGDLARPSEHLRQDVTLELLYQNEKFVQGAVVVKMC